MNYDWSKLNAVATPTVPIDMYRRDDATGQYVTAPLVAPRSFQCPSDVMGRVNVLMNNFPRRGTIRGPVHGERIWPESRIIAVSRAIAVQPNRPPTTIYWTWDETNPSDPQNTKGVFYVASKTKIKDITDGTSKTLMVAERDGSYVANYPEAVWNPRTNGFDLGRSD